MFDSGLVIKEKEIFYSPTVLEIMTALLQDFPKDEFGVGFKCKEINGDIHILNEYFIPKQFVGRTSIEVDDEDPENLKTLLEYPVFIHRHPKYSNEYSTTDLHHLFPLFKYNLLFVDGNICSGVMTEHSGKASVFTKLKTTMGTTIKVIGTDKINSSTNKMPDMYSNFMGINDDDNADKIISSPSFFESVTINSIKALEDEVCKTLNYSGIKLSKTQEKTILSIIKKYVKDKLENLDELEEYVTNIDVLDIIYSLCDVYMEYNCLTKKDNEKTEIIKNTISKKGDDKNVKHSTKKPTIPKNSQKRFKRGSKK